MEIKRYLAFLFTGVRGREILRSSPVGIGSKRVNLGCNGAHPRQEFVRLLPCYTPLLPENFPAPPQTGGEYHSPTRLPGPFGPGLCGELGALRGAGSPPPRGC